MARYLETSVEILHVSTIGRQVLDYLVLGMSLMKNIMKFKVLPPNFDSKHVPITATFNSSFVKFGKAKVVNHPNICKWDNQSAILFHS